ncbi:molybdopterin-binding protein [Massilia sp. Mn16-1_5]|uniref:molybdopterin-binding protein n=1 Tax=Massilia sp. Mn16-1_5 TaxID=2079199 RepID=UPI00109EC2FC|nr:molybdopterin-binding protein [Massilia sp. Mn16-1_5]THC39613.1 molybdopterin-binding protein [Massilia sp. Mn16-1_5]
MSEPARRRFLRLAAGAALPGVLSGCDLLAGSEAFNDTLRKAQFLSQRAQALLTGVDAMAQEFTEDDIAAEFRSNGTAMPDSALYRHMLADGFASWRLRVGGLVAHPAHFSLAELQAMPSRTQITRHDCVEGWSVIGKWTGVPLRQLLLRMRPLPAARYVVFHCADPMDGPDLQAPESTYYESIDLVEAGHPQTILAYALNDAPLPVKNGAPLRLRVERQLGYKQAKYLMRIDLVERLDQVRGGKGGYWEDRGYEWYAGI